MAAGASPYPFDPNDPFGMNSYLASEDPANPYNQQGQDPNNPGGDPGNPGGPGGPGGLPAPPSLPGSFPGGGTAYNPSLPNGSDPSNLPSGDPNVIQRFAISNTLGAGNNLINSNTNQQNLYGGREDQGYQQFNNLYNPIWQGGGGYTGDQQTGILQSGGPAGTDALTSEATDPNLQSQNYLTAGEQSQMRGNPYAAHDTAVGDIANLYSGSQNDATAQRSVVGQGQVALGGAVDKMAQGYSDAIDPSKLSASNDYFNSQKGAINTGDTGMTGDIAQGTGEMGGAIDTGTGQMESSLAAGGKGLTGAIDTGSTDMSSAIANPDLNVTGQYKQQAGMTDQEVANTAALGARAAGAGYESDIDAANTAAMASGQVNPMAMAALRDQLQREKGAAVTDATVQAQLNARGAQRAAATGVQQTELGAGQYKTGQEMSRAQTLLQSKLGSTLAEQQAQLGVASGQQGAKLSVAQQQEQARLNKEQSLMTSRLASSQAQENTRLGANQDISGRQMTAAGDTGLARIGTEEFGAGQGASTEANIAARNAQVGEYGTSLDVGSAQTAEQQDTARLTQEDLNRQATTGTNQANQFNRSFGVNQTLSNRYSQVANQYQQQQQEGRSAAAGDLQYQGSQANSAGQRALGAYGTETAGVTEGAGAYAGSKNTQSSNGFFGSNGLFGQLVKGTSTAAAGAGYAKGGIVTEPTHLSMSDGSEAIMGEAGPEAIVPLNNPEPMIEQLGRRIGDPFLAQIKRIRHQMQREGQAA